MVVILYQPGCNKIANTVAADLVKAFASHVQVELICASAATSWPEKASWDDHLIILYKDVDFPSCGNSFIRRYIKDRHESAAVLPVAVDLAAKRPPKAAATIKALEYDHPARGPKGRLVNRVGCQLGLRVQGRDSKIFISYRAKDGTKIARQLYNHFSSLGHSAFLDEAKDIDDETKILPGGAVQQQIDKALEEVNLVLLLDTAAAPSSPWIQHEVETADGLLLPILPICFRSRDDQKVGPRFRSLLALQRWVSMETPASVDSPLNGAQLDRIVGEAERYLCEIFQRKCRVPFLVENEFVSHGFAWKVLDKRLLMFAASRQKNWRVPTKVLSHCSVFDPNYSPAIKRFTTFLRATGRCNYSLFLYDGELLPDLQLREISESQDEPVIILHHQELAALIDSNFTTLAA
jgi:hypothetical protein